MPDTRLLERIRQTLWSADFDGGISELKNHQWEALIEKVDDVSEETKWMVAELFDYAGRYAHESDTGGGDLILWES